MDEETGKWIAMVAFLALGFIANAVSGGSWGKGAGIVLAVSFPLAFIVDVATGGIGFAAWVFAAVGVALFTHFLIFLTGESGLWGMGGGGDGYEGGNGGDGGGE